MLTQVKGNLTWFKERTQKLGKGRRKSLTEKWKHHKIVLPGEVHPVRNPSPAIAGLETERRIISNGVNIISDCALGRAPCPPVMRFGLSLSFKL